MVEALQARKPEEENEFIYANQCQSLHIGFNNYNDLKADEFKDVFESHNDVQKYTKFFKNELHYHKVLDMTDQIKRKGLRDKILKQADEMINTCSGVGINPYSVNVITFSGHGLTFDGDAIAVIPDIHGGSDVKVPRFINMSGLARKFASIENTINIFILSMCRVNPGNKQIAKLEQQNKDKEGEEEKGDTQPTYIYLQEDTMKQAKHEGYPQKGYSIMIFACQTSKVTPDGDLIKKIMKYYEEAKASDPYQNIGWKLINEVIPESLINKFSTSLEKKKYLRIKFLNSQKEQEERIKEEEVKREEERIKKEELEKIQNENLNRIRQQYDLDYDDEAFVQVPVQQQPILPAYSEEEIQEASIQDFLNQSQCSTDVNEKVYLKKELLGNKQYVTTLLYSGSLHGWMLINFHSRCNGKGPTLSLFKIQHGPCIGGYSKASWETNPDDCEGFDPEAFLFNLTYRRYFPVKDPEMAIKRLAEWGPYFGEGELGAYDEPFNSYCMGLSLPNEPAYEIKTDEQGINPLTNQKQVNFTISELEVWLIEEVV